MTEVVTYGTAAEAATDPDENVRTPSDQGIGRHNVPQDVTDRLDAYERRQAETNEQLLQQGRLLSELLASQASMSTMITQLNATAARLTAPAPAPAPAPTPALTPAPAQHEQGTADAVNKAAQKQGTAVTGDSSECQMRSPAACLQLLLRFREHDLPLFSDTAKRSTTNGPSMYAFIKQVRQELCCALEEGVRQPGFAAHQAIQKFTARVKSWLEPGDHSMTAILMEGIGFDQESAAAADVDNLVCVAVRCWDTLEEVITEVSASGKYNRSLCKHAGIMDEVGYRMFDPSTAAGTARWIQLRRLLIAYFKIPGSTIGEMERFKLAYKQHMQGDLQMRQYISKDDRLFREYMMAGGQVSDQTRIEWMQEKLSPAAKAEMEQHRSMLRALGKARDTLLTDWLVYSDALISVCSEV